MEMLLIGADAAVNKCIQPEFIRLAPPLMPLGDTEVTEISSWTFFYLSNLNLISEI
jgi:hypothetical protein